MADPLFSLGTCVPRDFNGSTRRKKNTDNKSLYGEYFG